MAYQVDNRVLIPQIAALLSEGREVRFTPSGVSMRPFIEPDRDSVTLRRMERPARRGDVLLVRMHDVVPEVYVLHRVLEVYQDGGVLLQGDGNLQGTEYAAPDDILGIVTAVYGPRGHRKPLTRAWLWQHLIWCRRFLLRVYRHTILKWYTKHPR